MTSRSWVTLLLATAVATGAEPMRYETGFEDGLTGWQQVGQATFGSDAAEVHGGAKSARITVAAGVEPRWQQLYYPLRPVVAGEKFEATFWVRTRLTDGHAYGAIEFLDAAGRRCGIAHSAVGEGNGAEQWDQLTISGRAPAGVASLRLNLILHGHGDAWFDDARLARTAQLELWPELGPIERRVTIDPSRVVLDHFAGVGFHVFHHTHNIPQTMLDEVVAKRWRELNPSFARLNDSYTWDDTMREQAARHMQRLKETGTELYLATWGPPDTQPGEERRAYARKMVDLHEYLYRTKGLTNLRWFCMSNELSLGKWGALVHDLPKFRDYHRELFDEYRRRGLPIGLLATDASPLSYWSTIEWAADHMDDITAIYGGHDYFNEWDVTDERFYPWFLDRLRWGAGLARARGKDFILGEFGSKQAGNTVNGKRNDGCAWWDTPQEPLVAIQLAEAAMAALNAGIYALGNWTFMDFPDEYSRTYQNKWGTFKWSGDDTSTRPHYYGYGLLTKFFRGPATVCTVDTNDPRLRAAAVRHNGAGSWSVAVVNRNPREVALRLALPAPEAAFRKYVYDPADPPFSRFGDLQPPAAVVPLRGGTLTDAVGAGQLVVYTTAYDDTPPAPVRGVRAEPAAGGVRVSWEASGEPDFCYYRVYRGEQQLVSTVATAYLERGATAREGYRVVAVDQSGNAGR